MENNIFNAWLGFLIGVLSCWFVIKYNRPVQKIVFRAQNTGCGITSEIVSNRLHDGDMILVIIDGDTLHNAVVENGEFKKLYRVSSEQPVFKKLDAPVDKNWIIENNGTK